MSLRHLFVASLGNPSPYASTLHSAGHIALAAIPALLAVSAFRPVRGAPQTSFYDAPSNAQVTLFQTPSYMNISGPSVAKAFTTWQKNLSPEQRRRSALVVVHDELELALGQVKLKKGGSHKGHNGVRSIYATLGKEVWRICVGIGRPESRDPDVVSQYVLSSIGEEKNTLVAAAPAVVAAVRDIASTLDE